MPTEQELNTAQKSTTITLTKAEPTMDDVTKTLEEVSLAEPREKPPTTLSSLFAVTEIGEAIMLQMDPRSIYTSMHVSKRWRAIYDSSSALKQHMFLNQEPGKHDLTHFRTWYHTNDGFWKPNTIIAPLNDGIEYRLIDARSEDDVDRPDADEEAKERSDQPLQDDRQPEPEDEELWKNYPWDLDYRKPRKRPFYATRRYFTHPLFPRGVVTLEWTPDAGYSEWDWCRAVKRKKYICTLVVDIFPDYQWRDRKYPPPGPLPSMLETMYLSDQPTLQYLKIVNRSNGWHDVELIWPGMRLIDVLHLVQRRKTGKMTGLRRVGKMTRLPRLDLAEVEPWMEFAKSIGIKLMPVRIKHKTYSLDWDEAQQE